MEEINFYLDFIKNRDADKVHKLMEKFMLYDLNNKPALMELEAEKLSKIEEIKSKGKK